MLEFWITDLFSNEKNFIVPCTIGSWEFHQRDNYNEFIERMENGQCVPSYYAFNESIDLKTSDDDFDKAIGELIDICLVLSFITATCVTPKGTTPQSDIKFLQLGDSFIRPRAIRGFDNLHFGRTLSDLFNNGLICLNREFKNRRMRLFLSHWISGLTCFSLEDIFLYVGVLMDIVRQCEISETGSNKTYFQGMESASNRYGIFKLGNEYKNMRNDIVHEGKLSGSNFSGRTKEDCAVVVSDALNWIDHYVWAVLAAPFPILENRWKPKDIEYCLPALSFQV